MNLDGDVDHFGALGGRTARRSGQREPICRREATVSPACGIGAQVLETDLFKHDGASDPPMKALTPLAACHDDVHTCRTRHVGRKTHAHTVSNDPGQECATLYCDTATPNPHSSIQLQLPRLQPPLYTARCTDTRRRRCDTRPTLAVPLPSCLAAARHCKQPDWSATPLANVLKRPGPTPHPRDTPCRTHRRLAHRGRRVCALCWSHSSLFTPARATKRSDALQQPCRVQGAFGHARWQRRRPHARAYCSGLLP